MTLSNGVRPNPNRAQQVCCRDPVILSHARWKLETLTLSVEVHPNPGHPGWNFPQAPMRTLQYHGMLSRNHDERGTCRRRMRTRHDLLLVFRVCVSEEVSTDRATWQATVATTMRIHQRRGLRLRFMHIIDHMIACVQYWLGVL